MPNIARAHAPTSTTRAIHWGDRGVEETLRAMADLANGGTASPAVVQLARFMAVTTGGVRQQTRQAQAFRAWLARVWRYVDDPPDRELLRDPAAILADYAQHGILMGDCDEAAILGAALGKAVGMGAQIVALSFLDPATGTERFMHVYAQLLTDTGEVVTLDVTPPRGPVPVAIRTMTLDV